MGHMEEIWELLRVSLPEFQLPELPSTEERAVSEERNKEDTPVVSPPAGHGNREVTGVKYLHNWNSLILTFLIYFD